MNNPAALALDGSGASPLEAAEELPGFEDESLVFRRLRWRIARATLTDAVEASRLRVALIILTTLAFWGGLYLLFREGFVFLRVTIDMDSFHEQAIRVIYSVFFASLMMMLFVSTGILMYGGLYRAEDTAFLLTLPVRPERIVLNKFQEALAMGSWGFLLLGSPMLVAYGVVAESPWYYYALIPLYMVSFVTIPGGLGALGCMLLVHQFAPVRRHATILLSVVAVAGLWIGTRHVLADPQGPILTPVWIHDVVSRLRFSEHRLLPSWWLSTGLLAAAHAEAGGRMAWSEGVLFLSLLTANALACHQLVVLFGGRTLRSSFSRHGAAPTAARHVRPLRVDTWIIRRFLLLPRAVRILLVKDLRCFRRDVAQWSQFLIFVGLLGLYFVNIRRFQYAEAQSAWIHMISFLNLSVVGLILATFTTRFVFPLVSLEGRKFWILGLLPVSRGTVLWGKFLFALLGTAVPAAALVAISDVMLGMPAGVLAAHQGTCILFCMGLAGIAVGLGAAMPDLRQTSPSRIAAGFGGTLNLVLSTLFIIAVVTCSAIPVHLAATLRGGGPLDIPFADILGSFSRAGLCALGWACSFGICVLATVGPMRMGIRRFQQIEP